MRILIAMLVSMVGAGTIWAQAGPKPNDDRKNVFFGKKDERRGDEKVRAVQGTVLSGDGEPVDGAIVQLKEASDEGKLRSVTTRRDGRFRFDDLSLTQDYYLEASYRKANSARRTISQFDSRKTVNIQLRLEEANSSANR